MIQCRTIAVHKNTQLHDLLRSTSLVVRRPYLYRAVFLVHLNRLLSVLGHP